MKNFLPRSLRETSGALARQTALLVFLACTGPIAFAQITSTTPASRCGEGNLTLHATAASGTITWFTVPFYGTPVGTGGSYTAEDLPVTTTFYVDALDEDGCSLNPDNARIPVIATISANSIQAIIFYSSNTFCKSIEGEQTVTRTGTAGGTFTVDPAGLTLNTLTGSITPSTSSEGTYTVTYTVVPQEGCVENPASTIVTITQAPEQPQISYAGSPYCTTHDPVPVTRTGASGGTFSAAPAGLTINATSGTITPSSSSSGTYTITYFVPGSGGCNPMNATTTVEILQLPTAGISYSSPFTKNQAEQLVTLTGTGVYTGGIYSSTAGLTINASSGAIAPSTSTAGTYTVTYTLAAVSPCSGVTTTTSVTIYPLPTATISGSTDVCQNSTPPEITFTGADGTPPYTFTYTINDGPELTVTTTSGNTVNVEQPTAIIGSYEYDLIKVSDATTSCQLQPGTALITVNPVPVALFEYSNSPYCSNATDPLPSLLEGGQAGLFTSSEGIVINASTGEIDLSASTPGTYTVTNTIAAALGCSEVVATNTVTISLLPTATLEYTGSPYCTNGTDPVPTGTGIGDGLFTSVPLGVQFVDNTTGVIDLSTSTPGTYDIVNTIAAASGCEQVTATYSSITIGTPAETPSINYSGSPFCTIITAGQPVELTGPTGGAYSADPAGLSLNASSGVIVPSTSTPGSYIVTYTVGGGGGCEPETATASVVIKESPVVTNSAAKTICSNTSTDILLTSSMGNTTFTWSLGEASLNIENGLAGSGDHIDQVLINTNFNDPGTIEYIITPHSEVTGCDGDPFTITVTVNPAVFLLITDPAAVCSPNTVDLTASAVTAGSANGLIYSYWTDPQATSPLTNPESVAVTGIYYIKATDANGCFDIKPVQTVINPLPTATITGTVTVCQNDASPLITFTGANASEPYTFTYKINGGSDLTVTTTSGSSVTVEAPTGAAGTFIYSLISVQDGSATSCSNGQSGSATVTVDPTSVAGTIGGGTTVCQGNNSTLLSLSGHTGDVVKWQYSTDGFDTDINDIANTNTTYTATDLTVTTGYRVIVKSGLCEGVTSSPATITVSADPQWTNYSLPSPATLCAGGAVSFSVDVTGGLGGEITWIRSDEPGGAGTTVTTGDIPGAGTWYYRPHYEPTGDGCDLADGTETTVTVSADPQWTNYSLPSPATLCAGGAVSFSVDVTGGLGGEITWIRSDEPGGAGTTVTTGDIPGAGTWYYRPHYEPTGDGCDLADGTETTVTVDPIPDPPTGSSSQSFYTGDPQTVANLSATGTDIQWYATSSGGTALEASTTLENGTHYYASQTISNCESAERLDVTVTINPVKNSTSGNNYPTIQEAIEDILTLDGHTIVVADGTYNLTAPVNITKEITLTGNIAAPANVVVNAPDNADLTYVTTGNHSCFLISADNVTIQGFTLQNAHDYFAPPYNTNGTFMQNWAVFIGYKFNGASLGTYYNDIDNTVIQNNIIKNSSTGIHLYNNLGVTIQNNLIQDMTLGFSGTQSGGRGIAIYNSPSSGPTGYDATTGSYTIAGNTIHDCDFAGISIDVDAGEDDWVDLTGSSIENNAIYDNYSDLGTGWGGSYAGLTGGFGIRGWEQIQGLEISGNEIYGSVSTDHSYVSCGGIRISGSNALVVDDNEVYNNERGIYLGATGATTTSPGVTNNVIYGNVHGVYIAGTATGVNISTNQIHSNTATGLTNSAASGVDADENWWGHLTGPTAASNPCGTGDVVSANVTYDPWYTDAGLTSLNGTVIEVGLSVSGPGTVCSGTETNISIALSQDGINYQLRNDNANELVGDEVPGTGGTINLPTGALTSTTTFNVLATHAITGCSAELSDTETVTVNSMPAAPGQGTHIPGTTQVQWNWNTVSGATGYKWGPTNDYNSATDMGSSTTYTQTGLSCNTEYTSYVWAYNANCNSGSTTLSATTNACTWTGGLTTYRGNNGSQYDFVVTGTTTGSTWGGCSSESYYFTDDTSLETAAVHGGFVANGQTKTVRIEIRAGLSSYSGCTSNGVTSSSYASWPGSYIIISSW